MENSISILWQKYVDEVMAGPVTKDPVQFEECKKSFYAGAGSALSMLREICKGVSEYPKMTELLIFDLLNDVEKFAEEERKQNESEA